MKGEVETLLDEDDAARTTGRTLKTVIIEDSSSESEEVESEREMESGGFRERANSFHHDGDQVQPTASSSAPALSTPILSLAAATSPPGTPSERKAFVVYRGARPGAFQRFYQIHPDDRLPGGVFKSFPSLELAREVYQQAFRTGVIDALNDEPLDGNSPQFYVVSQGVHPAMYPNPIPAMRDGLGWRGGALYIFHSRLKAETFFLRELNAGRTRQWTLSL
ncbi:hypothetical protein E1B28_010553 [Marasmius oreades]|uniref:Uncharacterized protein n=1 Tax=Marasmius oreades TaxID=181124 RepID=A0A9P7RXA9_9AGAR|nr:uncharacterized protein E1B28_010553 [Marasmius oreades]KAG7091524.1 hypothetical protein E1B28_010553 [Marasmius oreades]